MLRECFGQLKSEVTGKILTINNSIVFIRPHRKNTFKCFFSQLVFIESYHDDNDTTFPHNSPSTTDVSDYDDGDAVECKELIISNMVTCNIMHA